MRATVKIACIVGVALVLSACGRTGGDGSQLAPADAACAGPDCKSEAPPPPALACGGLKGEQCPQGYRCVDDPADNCDPANGSADCSGICMLGDALPQCGGLTGLSCPAGSVCVDDPADKCEGGPAVDCPGICRPQADGQCSADADCPQLGAPCSICADGTKSCPLARCDNGQCTVEFKACPEPQPCGGITGLACAPGFQCVDDPTDQCDPGGGGADCRGVCLPEESPRSCGGIAGVPCPPGFECVDDPNAKCDPQNGGADCPGVCQPASDVECKTDAECAPPAPCGVCPDGTKACSRFSCDNGRCSVAMAACPLPVMCGSDGSGCQPGEVCVDDPSDKCDPAIGGTNCPGACRPATPAQCAADADCPPVPVPCSICADGSLACARTQCQESTCTVVFDGCTGPGFCGGIAGFPCPMGSTCVDNPKDDCDPQLGGADCGGICVREEQPLSCGGFAGKPCPAGYECAGDPKDNCDPATGGADCSGICQPAPSPQCSSDADCVTIGAPCRLCADGSAACPRSFCENGTCRADFPTCVEQP